jgi:LysM repeat protein
MMKNCKPDVLLPFQLTIKLFSLIYHSLRILPVILLIAAASCTAQVPSKIVQIDGKTYYLHKVEKSQTVYAISKLYKCSQDVIVSNNPGAENGLKEGQEIKIPMEGSKKEGPVVVQGEKVFLEHEVKKKETWYSIAQQYQIDINALIAANPGSENGIKKGQILKVPIEVKKTEPKVDTNAMIASHMVKKGETIYSISKKYKVSEESIASSNTLVNGSIAEGQMLSIPGVAKTLLDSIRKADAAINIPVAKLKDSYNLAMLLPFYADRPDSLGLTEKERKLQDIALSMYRGAMVAEDFLQANGPSAKIYCYSAEDKKENVMSWTKKEGIASADLIIGPLFKESFLELAKWSNIKGIPIVCPVPQTNKILLSGPLVAKTVPSAAAQWEQLALRLYSQDPTANIVLVNSGILEDTRSIQSFSSCWLKVSGDTLKEFKPNDRSVMIGSLLKSGKRNIVIAPTTDKGVITGVFKGIGEKDAVVYGPDDWEDMEVIHADWRNKYHVHFVKTIWIDYGEPRVQEFVETYRRKFKCEPGEYAFVGHDLLLYYASGLRLFGDRLMDHLQEIPQDNLLASGYKWLKSGAETGAENQFIFVIGTDNYKLYKEDLKP